MSSSTFSTELTPEPRLRRIVLLSGVCTMALGLVTLLTMSGQLRLRLCGAAVWVAFSAWELFYIASGYKRCRSIRVAANGDVAVKRQDGGWQGGRLLSGSVVLSGLAWLRIEAADGRTCTELLRGNSRKNEAWRRLQVIWRHLGTAR